MLDKNNIAINHNEPRQQTFIQHTKHLDIGKSNYKISGLKNARQYMYNSGNGNSFNKKPRNGVNFSSSVSLICPNTKNLVYATELIR
jgi:hypothetical protein